jgi:hypothetical protein
MAIWSEIRSEYQDENDKGQTIIHIDGWLTEDENEDGLTIAKVNAETLEVEYIDRRAKSDKYAQEMINEVLTDLKSVNI